MAVLGSKTPGRIRRPMGKREGSQNGAQPASANCKWSQKIQTQTEGKIKMADEPVSRILCRTQTVNRPARAAIIPLGHGSHRDSSSLPEGFHPRWLAPPRKERVP